MIFAEGDPYNYEKDTLVYFVQSGATISPSAILSKEKVTLFFPVHISPRATIGANCSLGKYCFVNWDTVFYPNVTVGAYCSFGRYCEIGLADHPLDRVTTHRITSSISEFKNVSGYDKVHRTRFLSHRPTTIGNDVWVGAKVLIMSGVTVGDGAVIAAGSVVTKDVPPYTIVGGVPAKKIRDRFSSVIARRLQNSAWWNASLEQLNAFNLSDVDGFLKEWEAQKCGG